MLKAVTYILENDSSVQVLVGANAASDKHKVYPVVVPKSEIEPYIVVRVASKTRIGKSCGFNYTIQVTSLAASYDLASEINEAVILALESETPGTVNGVDFGYLNFVTEHDEFTADKNTVTFEHELYAKVATFEGVGEDIPQT